MIILKTTEFGLTNKQVIESRTKYGSNKISRKKQNSLIKIFIESLGEPMTKILLIALAIKTLFLLSNFDWYETIGIAIAIFIGIKDPITVVQMLWVNMIMDTLAALAFAGEPALSEYMLEKPKRRNENIINHYMFGQIIFTGLYSFLLCLLFLKLPIIQSIFVDNMHLMTAFFGLFIFIGIFNCFNARTHRLNIIANVLKNKGFIIIMMLITSIQIYIIYYGGSIFRTDGLRINEFIFIILLAITVVPFDWIRKIWLKRHNKNTGV